MTIDIIEDSEGLQDYETHYNKIDHEVACADECNAHSKPMNYAGFKRGPSYRAFAYCPVDGCDNYYEF